MLVRPPLLAVVLSLGGVAACATETDPEDVSVPPSITSAPEEPQDGGIDPRALSPEAMHRPPLPIPELVSTAERCKLINGVGLEDPTANQTHFRANLMGTDLGIPVRHDDRVFFFFGDTAGFRGIWRFGDSLPDAVGYADESAAALAEDPSLLCSKLRFLGLDPDVSIGPSLDPRIERDFAGTSMTPPPGHTIGEFIHNPAGHGSFPTLPGDFEVPSGAFSHGGSIYVFFTTVDPSIQMKGSYLAKWSAPKTTGVPSYDILYHVDQRFDASGPLRGDFINVAAMVHGAYVYLYGTGDYRRSPVHLARKALATIEQPGGFERFDGKTRTWVGAAAKADPVVAVAGNGEMSVVHYPEIDRFMMLNQLGTPGQNRVVARFSESPEGPWSDAIVVHDMGDPAFRAKYCCTKDACLGEQLFHCDRAGFYGTYLFPEARVLPDGRFVVTYTMSTWDPYNVALMQATFAVP